MAMIMQLTYPLTVGARAQGGMLCSSGRVPDWKPSIRLPPLLLALSLAGCGMMSAPDQPASFSRDVYPILQANCHACHLPPDGEGYRRSGLNMGTYAGLMRGTRYGPVVVPCDSRHSILSMLVEGRADPSMRMSYHKTPLGKREVDILARWIEQGALDN